MKSNYDIILDGIRRLFSDTSVSRTETKMMLNDLSGEIDTMLEALKNDGVED